MFHVHKQMIRKRIMVLVIIALFIVTSNQSQFCNQTSSGAYNCYPCYYKCKQCTSLQQTSCAQCTKQYILINSTCISCGQNCLSCKNIVNLQNINKQNIQNQCQNCVEGYYLSQSTGKCIQCARGVKTCTLSAVQACQEGYYQQNGVCLKGPDNCLQCSNSLNCQVCAEYYYLNSTTKACQRCDINKCLICDPVSQQCLSCQDGYAGSKCSQVCDQNCGICYFGTCFMCKDNYYLLNSKCAPLKLFCQASSTYQRCQQCIQSYSTLSQDSNSICLPLYTTNNQNRLIYLTAVNNYNKFSWQSQNLDNSTGVNATKSLQYCLQPLSVYIVKTSKGKVVVSVSVEPSYKIRLFAQVFVGEVQRELVVSGDFLQSVGYISFDNATGLESAACGNGTYYYYNIKQQFWLSSQFDSTQNTLQITFSLPLSTGLLGISQFSLQLYRCLKKNCLVCKSPYTCQSCISSFRLQNNQCSLRCQQGYYFTEIYSRMTCTLQCLKGYYPLREEYVCRKCTFPCTQCQGQQICNKCYANATSLNMTSFFLFNSSCVTQCPTNYFANLDTFQCQQCIFPCGQCSQFRECNTCQVGYLDQKKCVMKCPQGKYQDFSQLKCLSCQDPCKQCNYAGNKCQQCIQPYFLFYKNTSCLTSCPQGYYKANQLIKQCKSCEFPCKTCQVSSQNCSSCTKGYLYQNDCYSQCPATYYQLTTLLQLNNICQPCRNNCYQCEDDTICLSCSQQYKLNVQQKSCVDQCPNGTYQYVQTGTIQSISYTLTKCQQCIPPCFYCTNQTYCISCTGLFFLNHKGQCLMQCPVATYIYYNVSIQQRQCNQCPSQCQSCLSYQVCTQCKAGWLLSQGLCYLECPPKTFANQQGYKLCQTCNYPCQLCRSYLQCTSCVKGFLIQEGQYRCVEFCSQGYFQQITNITCLKCNIQCATCISSKDNCLTCAVGYYLNFQINKCTKQCPALAYYSKDQRQCRNCQYPCKKCRSYLACTECYQKGQIINSSSNNTTSQHILYLSHCVAECPKGYFQTLDAMNVITCKRCQFQCQQCSLIQTNCTKCKLPSLTFNYQSSSNTFTSPLQCLLVACPSGYYSISYTCQPCQYPCKSCQSNSFCLTCIDNWYFLQGQCLQTCPFHYYSSTSDFKYPNQTNVTQKTCLKCSQTCRQCINQAQNCTSCTNNYYLFQPQAKCLSTCSSLYYPSPNQMKCLKCQTPCLQCYSQKYCITCQSGYLKQLNKCVLQCSSSYYLLENTKTCIPCQSPCQKCRTKSQCQSCVSGYYFLQSNSSCVSECPSKMYQHKIQSSSSSIVFNNSSNLNQSTPSLKFKGSCLPCSQLCLQCSSYRICTKCNFTSDRPYLQQQRCQSICSQGYYYNNDSSAYYQHTCDKCQQNCLSCTSYENCYKCIYSYLLNNKCLEQCPSLYYGTNSFDCRQCRPPCEQCLNDYSCISCIEGYFLYDNNICIKRCPLTHWTDKQQRKCVLDCPQQKFKNQNNKTCLVKCQKFHNSQGYCVSQCNGEKGQYSLINSTLGCLKCTQHYKIKCQEIYQKLQYKLEYIVINGRIILIVKFSTKMLPSFINTIESHQQQKFKQKQQFKLFLQKKVYIQEELDLYFLSKTYNPKQSSTVSSRQQYMASSLQTGILEKLCLQTSKQASSSTSPNLPQSLQVSLSSFNIISLLQNSLWLQINDLTAESYSSGYLSYQINEYLQLLSKDKFQLSTSSSQSQSGQQNLPFQQVTPQKIQLVSFSPDRKLPQTLIQFMRAISLIFSWVILILLFINLVTDNLKSMFHLVDSAQNLFLILWIGKYIQLGINDFLKGFQIASFVVNLFVKDTEVNFYNLIDNMQIDILWNCSSKQLLYGTFCLFIDNYLSLLVFIGIFILTVGSCRLIIHLRPYLSTKLKIQHKIIYNHINGFYWLFISSIWFISTSQFLLKEEMNEAPIVSLILIIFCSLLTLVLGFQLLKNIFNCSFEERTFFWGLKCHKIKNQQANIHFLLIMIRKTIVLISVTLTTAQQNKPLVYFFLLTFSTIFILSNILANSPFKRRLFQNIITTCQTMTIFFYLGILIYIVNVQKFDQSTYIAYNSALLFLAVTVIMLHLIIVLIETYGHIKRKYLKHNKLEQNSNQDESKSSSCDDNSEKGSEMKRAETINKLSDKKDKDKNSQKQPTIVPIQSKAKGQKGSQSVLKNRIQEQQDQETQTNQQKINNIQQGEYDSSSGFQFKSQMNSQQFEQPAKYLIKVQKKLSSQQSKSNKND